MAVAMFVFFKRVFLYLFRFFLSTFCFETKGGAQNSRTAQSLRVPVWAKAQQPVITCKYLTACSILLLTIFLTMLFLRTVFFDADVAKNCWRSIPFSSLYRK
jgi:hypothetical protein